jgi:hypothetical protein
VIVLALRFFDIGGVKVDDFPLASSLFKYHCAASNRVRKVIQMESGDGSVLKYLNVQISRLEVEIGRRALSRPNALKDLPKRCLNFSAAGGSICALRWKVNSRVISKTISEGFPVKIVAARNAVRVRRTVVSVAQRGMVKCPAGFFWGVRLPKKGTTLPIRRRAKCDVSAEPSGTRCNGWILQLQQFTQPLRLCPRYRNFRLPLVIHLQQVARLQPRHHFLDVIDVDQIASVRA